MTNSTDFDTLLDAIDWDTPTSLPTENHLYQSAIDKNPALYKFITTAAELIPDHEHWLRFTQALDRFEKSRGRP